MHQLLVVVLLVAALGLFTRVWAGEGATTRPASVLDFTMKDIDGRDVALSQYRGKVLLIVNVASRCGNTPQYAGLQSLYEKYAGQGLVVMGFPANDFGKQEPGSDEQIKEFCSTKYNVTFPMFSKIVVKGEGQHPLYAFLTSPEGSGQFAGEIKWNFAKFLVGRNGKVVGRFDPKTKPDDPALTAAIEAELAKK